MGKNKKKKSGAQQQQQQQQQQQAQAPAPQQVPSQSDFPSLSGIREHLPSAAPPSQPSSSGAGASFSFGDFPADAGAPQGDGGQGRGKGRERSQEQGQQGGRRDEQGQGRGKKDGQGGGGRRDEQGQGGGRRDGQGGGGKRDEQGQGGGRRDGQGGRGRRDEQGRGSGPGDQRPGDWLCPSCNKNNFARNTDCFKCKTPKPQGGAQPQRQQQQQQEPQQRPQQQQQQRQQRPQQQQQPQQRPQQQQQQWPQQQPQQRPQQQQQQQQWPQQQPQHQPRGDPSAPEGAGRGRGRGGRGRGQQQEECGSRGGTPQRQQPPASSSAPAWGASAPPPQQQAPAPAWGASAPPPQQQAPASAWGASAPPPQQQAPAKSQPPKKQQPRAQESPSPSFSSGPSPSQPSTPSRLPSNANIPKRPNRPKLGIEGQKVRLLTNHFEVDFKPNAELNHYDVTFVDFDRAPKKLKRNVMFCLTQDRKYQDFFGGLFPCYDGQKNLYTTRRINGIDAQNGNGVEFEVDYEEDKEEKKTRKFKIKIKYAETYFASDLVGFMKGQNKVPVEVFQVFDVALRYQSLRDYIQAGRNVYIDEKFLSPYNSDLGGGLCSWYGAFTSLRPGMWKITLNVDLSTTAFVKNQAVIDYMNEVLFPPRRFDEQIRPIQRNFAMDQFQKRTFTKQLKGLKVQVTHQGMVKRKYTVVGISDKTPTTHTFDCQGTKMNVQQYFQKTYQYRILHERLQLLHVGKKEKDIFIPMEVCTIVPGQKYPHKINEKQTAAMIKVAAVKPGLRQKKIEEIVRRLDFQRNREMKNFGLSVASRPIEVEGRVLGPPTLAVGNRKTMRPKPDQGAWDMRRDQFYEAVDLKRWGVLNFASERDLSEQDLNKFVSGLIRQGKEVGMNISNPCYWNRIQDRNLEQEISKLKGSNLQLVLCVLGFSRTPLYERIKVAGDVDFDIPTQCIKARNAQKAAPPLISNMLLKINAKIGGVNNILIVPTKDIPFLDRMPTLIMGADVTHPAPSEKTRPSIAALVANMDPSFSRYVTDVRVQGHRVETITDLKLMVYIMLKKFYQLNKSKPQNIIMYRDGVSEGQFDIVICHELKAIQDACREICPQGQTYKPCITFIVVQKRHHTRLFPHQGERMATRDGNVLPGTVVDTGVTHPFEFDFFLNSHYALQGTSKPAHYHILYDDYGFKSDEIQKLSYYLCYMCFRCTRSISIPAPTYYAHLGAFRARHHLTGRGLLDESDSGSTMSGSSGRTPNLAELQSAIQINTAVGKTMYFN